MTTWEDWKFRADFLNKHADLLEEKARSIADSLLQEASNYRVLAVRAESRANEIRQITVPDRDQDETVEQNGSFQP